MQVLNRPQFQANPYFVEYERLLRRLHELHCANRDASAEADGVDNAMDRLVPHLDRDEVDRLNGLSADLYMLSGDEVTEPLPSDMLSEEVRKQMIAEALEQEEWERALNLLRYGLTSVAAGMIALARGRCYTQLGHIEAGKLFLEYAAQQSSRMMHRELAHAG